MNRLSHGTLFEICLQSKTQRYQKLNSISTFCARFSAEILCLEDLILDQHSLMWVFVLQDEKDEKDENEVIEIIR